MRMSLPNIKKVNLDLKKYDRLQRRLLSNELKDLESIRSRKEKNMLRDQMEIRRELWKLNADQRKRQNMFKEKTTQTADQKKNCIKQLRTYVSVPVTLSVLNPSSQEIATEPRRKEGVTNQSLFLSSPTNFHQNKPTISSTLASSTAAASQDFINHRKLPVIKGETTSTLNESVAMISLRNSKAIDSEYRKSSDQESSIPVDCGDATAIAGVLPSSNKKTRLLTGKKSAQRKSSQSPKDEAVESNQESADDFPTDLLRETTKSKLKEFLSEQGIDIDKSPALAKLSDDIIAMRNLGKSTDQIWDDVRNCRYLRGYDPPVMRIPEDTNQFVFGSSTAELYQKHLRRIAKQVEAARQKRSLEAEAATYKLLVPNDEVNEAKEQYKLYMKSFFKK